MKLIYHILSEVEVKDQSEIINTIAEYSHAILQDYTNYLQLRATENVHHISEVQRHNSRLKSEKSDLIHLKNRISDDLSAANNKIAEIESTKAFRINRKLRNIKYAALTPKRVFSNRRHDHTTFHERAGKQIFDRTSSGAVILHLYYQDMWQYFSPQLNFLINTQKLDLFISMIENDTTTETKNEILKDYPKAHIFIMPNRGRDVLPFITISKILLNSGYEYFLKIHSKKSPQRHDGNTWANEIFTNLMIQEETDFHKLKRILTNSHTGLAGPANCYVPLPTYYNDNHHEIIRLISKIKDKKVASRIDKEKWDYGFFAGTMFWGRLDAIEPVINTKIRIMDFVEEGAQLDGTVAHALERVFCVIPELNKKSMYEITKGKVKKINYKTDYTPEWSDHYKEDK